MVSRERTNAVTYSIVARHPAAGQLGAAIASHVPAIGARSLWAEPAVGVAVSQANYAVQYGPGTLSRLAAGLSPAEAIAELTAVDPMAHTRQVAAVSATGELAVHSRVQGTGGGHVLGEDFSTQANMLLNDGGPEAMARALMESSGEPLKLRMLAALDAAEATGGDIRGRQGAAMVIVGENTDGWSGGWLLDLRVDDHPTPLQELRRLVELTGAMAVGGDEGAGRYFELGNGNPEGWFYRGIELANAGDVAAGRDALDRAYAVSENWREHLRRMPFMVRDAAVMEQLLA